MGGVRCQSEVRVMSDEVGRLYDIYDIYDIYDLYDLYDIYDIYDFITYHSDLILNLTLKLRN